MMPLSLAVLTFLHPWGFFAFASLAAIGVIYLFYQRYRERPVSAFFLWDAEAGATQGGRRLQRPKATRSLLLDLLAAALLALAIAAPAIESQSGAEPLILLDDSLSMQGGENHLAVQRAALALLPESGAWVVAVGARPRVLATPDGGKRAAEAALATYTPSAGEADLLAAIHGMSEIVPGESPLHLFTDQPVAPLKEKVHRSDVTAHQLAGAGPNLAVVTALRTWDENASHERIHLVVKNFSAAPARATLRVALVEESPTGGVKPVEPPIHTAALALPAGGVETAILELSDDSPTVSVEVTGADDRLAPDSLALLAPSPSRKVEVGLDLAEPSLRAAVSIALRAAGATPETLEAPAPVTATPAGGARAELAVPTRQRFDLLVTARPRPEPHPWGEAPLTLRLLPVPASETPLIGPFLVDLTHPLGRELDLTGVIWAAAGESPVPFRPATLIRCGATPLYGWLADGSLALNADPLRGNLTRTTLWPVLFHNLVREALALRPGLKRANYRPGEVLEWRVDAGHPLPDRLVGEGIELSAAPLLRLPWLPGLYRLFAGEQEVGRVAVQATLPAESDLSGLATESSTLRLGDIRTNGMSLRQHSLAWLPALLAILTAALNWRLARHDE